ncbi:hypothetical protein NLG97_g931 [Lecanicillium saksenae]|uniref:Uncharacterized protein n=1 Tax=Lecanicillium saksenae TaxID=468837 RepID=A0ACC1R554_9HYPO|nr:hypothetical protein NLG97_g931 [Lecanicillium saksenae]
MLTTEATEANLHSGRDLRKGFEQAPMSTAVRELSSDTADTDGSSASPERHGWHTSDSEQSESCRCDPGSQCMDSVSAGLRLAAGNVWASEPMSKLASSLADELAARGVRPGSLVLLVFEQSMSMHLATLCVVKAGGTAIVLDVTQSSDRLSAVAVNIPSSFTLCSEKFIHLLDEIGAREIIVLRDSGSSFDLVDGNCFCRSETEQQMRRAWSKCLGVSTEDIRRNDNFFHLGGNALQALQLPQIAKRFGLTFSVRDVFDNPTLDRLAARAEAGKTEPMLETVAAFSLLTMPTLSESQARTQASYLCQVQESQILDILPCTPLQEGLLSLTTRHDGDYVARNVFELRQEIDLVKFRAAWDQVVALNPILRTRIASLPHHGLMQIVLEDEVTWTSATDLDDYSQQHCSHSMALGAPLTRFAILENPGSGPRFFLWEIHHALYDGWSMPLLMREAENVYFNRSSEVLQSIAPFVEFIQSMNMVAAQCFWKSQFANLRGKHFPSPSLNTYFPRPDQQRTHKMQSIKWNHGDVTASNIIRSAWAVTVAQMARSDEALFGTTVTGRQAPLANIKRMTGPTIATVPIHVPLDWNASINQLLHGVQRQAVDMIPYEQMGLQHIRRVSEEAAFACNFQSLLVVQPVMQGNDDSDELLYNSGSDVAQDAIASQWQDFSTFAVVVECQLETAGLQLRLAYDSSMVPDTQIDELLQRFEHVLLYILDDDHGSQRLGTVGVIDQGLDAVWAQNQEVPDPIEGLVHDMIVRQCHLRPLSPAICAWDGELTYEQLDKFSTVLACQLLSKHVKPGDIVPLFFEKSVCMPLSVVAVMKCGGAPVALDMDQPEERLRTIVSSLSSSLAMSSTASATTARTVLPEGSIVIHVRPQLLSETVDYIREDVEWPEVSPSSLLYVVFTSGSTGEPKGVMISHRNFCSAIHYQQVAQRFTADDRVFDFASYAFDASWANLLQTLTAGGCLCIPSPVERQNDLAKCFDKYRVTLADLTPSVARFLGPTVLSRLSTLLLGGEAVTSADVSLAGTEAHTKIVNVYGPAECTPTVTIAALEGPDVTIGQAVGACAWVVDPESCELAPIGSIGELWVEGPLVGGGYLNGPEKTAASFVHDPSWLLQGSSKVPGRRARLYRTGDLVQYKIPFDGTLIYIGRKDTQVKIHGQRLELGEIEHNVKLGLTPATLAAVGALGMQVIATTVQPNGQGSVSLVAFVTLNMDKPTEASHSSAVKLATAGLPDRLATMVPPYMIPAAFIPLHKIPVTVSGKADRKQLQALAEASFADFRNNKSNQDEAIQPLGDMETQLQQIWMSVLNLSTAEVPINKSFVRLGGDSISAMQVVSRARLRNIECTVTDILQSATIEKLAPRCKNVSRSDVAAGDSLEADGGDGMRTFDLSPVQQMFFDAYPDGIDHWNQSFTLQLNKHVPVATFVESLQAIVSRHAMLRARFEKDVQSNRWVQSFAEDDANSFSFAEHSPESLSELHGLGQKRQEQLNIRKGPVFAADLFTMPDGRQTVILSAHHLVIDLVSWRIIWNDIQEYIDCGKLLSAPPVSFQTWCRSQAKVGQNMSPLSVLPFTVPAEELEFWELPLSENTFGGCETYTQVFDKETSALIFGESNECLHTEAIDIMLGVLAHSFHDVFPERSVPPIWLESHGRNQSEVLRLDISGTVGWFTAIYPVPIAIKEHADSHHAVRLAKDLRQQVPDKGVPYFTCRYLSRSGQEILKGHDIVEVILNFTGSFQQLEADAGLFKQVDHAAEDMVDLIEVSEVARRMAMIEISADISDGQLSVSFQVHGRMSHQDRLHKWTLAFAETMQLTTRSLLAAPSTLTLSDMPLLHGLSHDDLDILQQEILPAMGIKADEAVNMYPCSPLQEGILLSSQKGSASYATFSVFRCVTPADSLISVSSQLLESAWRQVARRHSILATVFCINPQGTSFLQVLLRNPDIRVSTITTTMPHPDHALLELDRPRYKLNEPQHAFTVCYSTASGEVACRLDVSHALIDATSISILVQEVAQLYDGQSLEVATGFAEVIKHIGLRGRSERLASWMRLLDGVGCCLFPTSYPSSLPTIQSVDSTICIPTEVTAPIVNFCKELSITRSVFLQVAWALVLSHFTGMDDVCYGNLASGRDVPLNGIDSIVGPLSNMLIGRVNLRVPALQALRKTADTSIHQLSIQNTSLAEIQHSLGLAGKRLFNTTLSVRNEDELKIENTSLGLDNVNGEDPHEFEIGLSAGSKGNAFSVIIEFREPEIAHSVAQEVSEVLIKAIEYLLSIETGDKGDLACTVSGAEPMWSDFFKYAFGADEAATRSFWLTELEHIPETHFLPAIPVGVAPRQKDTVTANLSLPVQLERDSIPIATIFKAGWAITMAKIMGTNKCLFGVADENWHSFNIIPTRVSMDWEGSGTSLLQKLHRQEADTACYTQIGLGWIRRLSEDVALACDFQTVLAIPKSPAETASGTGICCGPGTDAYALVAECRLIKDTVQITLSFNSDIGRQQISRINRQFQHIISELLDLSQREKILYDIALDPADLADIWAWNSSVPQPVNRCFQDIFIQNALVRPFAPAICAWDGELTYQQLHLISDAVARYLHYKRGLGIGSIASLCFEKSIWMPVCALAVAKCGGASAAIDPGKHPAERLRAITKSSQLILCSHAHESLSLGLGTAEVVVIRPEDFLHVGNQPAPWDNLAADLPTVVPSDRFCIQFTSGSTGVPKGVVLTHQNICAALAYQKNALGFRSDSRVLDFASYAFDVAWSNLTNTLAAGGCLCIPSELERENDLAGSVLKYNVSMIDATPSLARNLPSSALRNLTTLCLGGEVVLPSDLLLGGNETTTLITYGPAECTPTSTIQTAPFDNVGIGRGVGLCTWVVDKGNPGALAPIGAVGELWLEGPLVGEGYLNDAGKTAEVFVEDPQWLLHGNPASGRQGRRGRLYRTGDLVRYCENGSLIFLGRKDTQVKIRGQRVELAEVEHQVMQALAPAYTTGGAIVAEAFTPHDSSSICLVCFISIKLGADTTDDEHKNAVQTATRNLSGLMAQRVPSYMVPSAYIPIRSMPMTATGKVDRKRLQHIGSSLSVREIGAFSGAQVREWKPAESETERRLQALWAEVLNITPESIGIYDSFFRLGGDSISAMQLVGLARQAAMPLTVGDVFRHPILCELASLEALATVTVHSRPI